MYKYIPIIVICYNNYKYVKNTLEQIKKINLAYYKNIIIMDNCSTCINTINFLKDSGVDVIYRKANTSPQVSMQYNRDVYDMLPDKFILTDPDLEFNIGLPNNFVEILSNLSDKYNSYKIGFALDISDFDKMYPGKYFLGYNIYDWENNFWQNRIKDIEYELYTADIDTTFALINKKNIHNINIRVAGNFLAKHLPWYIDNKINNLYESYILYQQQTKISTIKSMVINFIEHNYNKVYKHNEMFLIKKENPYIDFWINNYMSWKNEAFDIFDKYMDQNKIFIDVGASIGGTSLYASRKSKHVYCIEADKQLFNNLTTNMKINCCNNFTLINKNITDEIDKILVDYHINENEISLINIDIKGEEEDILFNLYNIHNKYNIPLYIYFYYDKWKDKNLDRFYFLDDKQKKKIQTNSYKSLLFSNHIIESFENFENCNKNWLNLNIVTVLLMICKKRK
jgi:hypothetical protein